MTEDRPLGTAGAVKNVEEHVRDGDFLVLNGDILTDLDLRRPDRLPQREDRPSAPSR